MFVQLRLGCIERLDSVGVRVQVWEKDDVSIGHLHRGLSANVVHENGRNSLAGSLPFTVAQDALEALRVVEKEIVLRPMSLSRRVAEELLIRSLQNEMSLVQKFLLRLPG